MMKKYTVTTNEDLRLLCIKNNWFTCGSNEQYEKLFRANEGLATIEEIATIIWICSDENQWCRRDILSILEEHSAKKKDTTLKDFILKIVEDFNSYSELVALNNSHIKENNSLNIIIHNLESLFSKFNRRYFENELQKPIITVSPDTTSGAYGWCTGWKAWQEAR